MACLIERVARAICAAKCKDPDAILWQDPQNDPVNTPNWTAYVDAAKAALEAMQCPTPEMLNEAHECTVAGCELVGQEQAGEIWDGMIAAALEGK